MSAGTAVYSEQAALVFALCITVNAQIMGTTQTISDTLCIVPILKLRHTYFLGD